MPSPERIAWAHALNWWRDARRFPKDVLTDLALLMFVALMLLGFQYQMVTDAAVKFGDRFQSALDALPYAAGAITLLMARANPLAVRLADRDGWPKSLPIANNLRAHWALRKALYAALLISAVTTIPLIDVIALDTQSAGVKPLNFALVWTLPVLVVCARAVLNWNRLLDPPEQTTSDKRQLRDSALLRTLPALFADPIARQLASAALADSKPIKLWSLLIAASGIAIGTTIVALCESQPQLLLIGAAMIPILLSSGLEPRLETLFGLSRSLPLTFRRLVWANAKWGVLLPVLCASPIVIAALFVQEGGYWFLAVLGALCAVTALLFLKILIALAFPTSRLKQTMFTLTAALGVGIVAMQAPLFGPILGAGLCSVWLIERGWGAWEFGYGGQAQ